MIELNDDEGDDIEMTLHFMFGYFPNNTENYTDKSVCVLISSNSLRLINYLKNPDIDIISYPSSQNNNNIQEIKNEW